jgi:excisionase family DNA binding protein
VRTDARDYLLLRTSARYYRAMTNTTTRGVCTCGRQPLVLTVRETCHVLRISRRTVEALIRSGALTSYKIGTARRVDAAAVLDYLDRVKHPTS